MYEKFSESILLPKLIRLKENLILAKFELMKIIPAKYIVEQALQNGAINSDTTVVETSSGTFALGLGIICREYKLPFYIISDPIMDHCLAQQLKNLGGQVKILDKTLTENNPQQARLDTLKKYLTTHSNSYWTCQYDNKSNQDSYAKVANYLLAEIGQAFTLVGAVGSGGSTGGTMATIRKKFPDSKLVGVDTYGSVLFGLTNQKRMLRGLGNSLLPKNVDHSLYDQIHWVSANDAFFHTQWLHYNHALFCGPTTGATHKVAAWLSANYPDELIVFFAADTGHRYQNTVYSNKWLRKFNFGHAETIHPQQINHPQDAITGWDYFAWNRRSYSEIMREQ